VITNNAQLEATTDLRAKLDLSIQEL
jgi:hypothetical protein